MLQIFSCGTLLLGTILIGHIFIPNLKKEVKIHLEISYFLDFVPEAKDIFVKRYEILNYISKKSSVGRRNISSDLNISERFVRETVEILKSKDLLFVGSRGISITNLGIKYVKDFSSLYEKINTKSYDHSLLLELRKITGLKNIFISNSSGKELLGKFAAGIIKDYIEDNFYIGVTGGETLSFVSEFIETDKKNLRIVPARGSIGIRSKFQANTVASRFANRTHSESYIVPLPDTASSEILKSIMDSKELSEIMEKLKSIDLLIFGIGRADVMAKRRGLNDSLKDKILHEGACGEAFGNYFDIDGNVILHRPSIGISLEDYKNIGTVIAVCEGYEKADATLAICKLRNDLILIIDESLAKEIIRRNLND